MILEVHIIVGGWRLNLEFEETKPSDFQFHSNIQKQVKIIILNLVTVLTPHTDTKMI